MKYIQMEFYFKLGFIKQNVKINKKNIQQNRQINSELAVYTSILVHQQMDKINTGCEYVC